MHADLGEALEEQKKFAEAEESYRLCVAIREKKMPDAWITSNTWSMLGGAMLGQKKYADAEPMLLKGYAGMEAREKTLPPLGKECLREALARLIELYTATKKPDEVKKYRDLRAEYPPELAPPPREKK